MSAPLMLEMDVCPLERIVEALQAAGIVVVAAKGTSGSRSELICRRGRVSFALSVHPDTDPPRLVVMFSADLSAWRWWNFPLHWLSGLVSAPGELALQRDAYEVLRTFGARRTGGGDVLDLD